jgi:glutathione S-transferase
MPTLTHFRLCPFSRAIRMALAEARIEAELREERPWDWRRELLELNPSGALPVLELDGGEAVCGSYAISEYLDETIGAAEAGLPVTSPFPGAVLVRAEVRRLVDWFHGKMHEEVTRHLIEEKVASRFKGAGSTGPDIEVLRAVRENLRYHLSYVEHLAAARRWLAGEEMTYADMAAAAHLSCADYLGEIDWSGIDAARGWYARMKSRSALRAILAERLPGAPNPPDHYADPDF